MVSADLFDTLPKILRKNFVNHPDKKAMRVKENGIWQTYTWKDYYQKSKDLCLGLVSLGMERGVKISILGENKPQWYWAELATLAAGGIAIGIFADCTPSEVKYYVEHSDSTFVIVHNQEQVDKLLEIKNQIPTLQRIIYWDEKGVWTYSDPLLMSFDHVLELGRSYEKKHPGLFEEIVDQGRGEDIAVICYSSGTGSLPKGVMLSHQFLIGATEAWSKLDNWYGKRYQYLSFVPPAWAVEQITGVTGSILSGVIVNFPEEPESVQDDLREIGPEIVFYGARLWEYVNRMVQSKMIDASLLKRTIYKAFLPVGLRVADVYIEQKKPNVFLEILYLIAHHAVFRQLRDRLGLIKVKVAYSAGGSLSPEIIRYFKALGIEIKLFYGSTEVGMISNPRDGEIRPETSGRVVPWAQVKIADDGEILVKSQFMYSGYYKNLEATQKALKEGWYHTGDFGHLDDGGHLIVIDRMNDLKPLSGGRRFSPQYTEARLRFSPFVKNALVVGDEERDFVSAIINVDFGNAGRYADSHRIPYTTFADLSQKAEVIELIGKEIEKINRTLPDYARVKRYLNLHKELDADESELTRTRKLRRSYVEKRYEHLINALYSNTNEASVEAKVAYQDGKTGVISMIIKINDV